MPEVIIVILNWRNAPDTMACIDSIASLAYRNWRLIVCDNASGDGSLELISAKLKEIGRREGWSVALSGNTAETAKMVLVDTGDNLGYAGGNNVGLRIALKDPDCSFAWLLNNDTIVDRNALDVLVARALEEDRPGLVGSTLLYAHAPHIVQAMGGSVFNFRTATSRHIGEGQPHGPIDRDVIEHKMDCLVGASMLVSRAFLETVGLLSEDYFLYFEEMDWAMRGRHAFRLGYAPGSIIFHKEGGTVGLSQRQRNFGGAGDYYIHRNRLVFARKFVPQNLPMVIAGLLKVFFGALLLGRWKRAKMFFNPAFWFGKGRAAVP